MCGVWKCVSHVKLLRLSSSYSLAFALFFFLCALAPIACRASGMRLLLWKHYKHVLVVAMMKMLMSKAVWMLETAGEGDRQLLRKQSEEAAEAADQVSGVHEGLKKGFENLGENLMEGLTGAIRKPLDGAASGGLIGFLQGVGAGAVGVVSKPILGVTQFGQILGDALDANLLRLRPPRAVYFDRVLRVYLTADALAVEALRDEEVGLRGRGQHRSADACRRMYRNFVCFCKANTSSGTTTGGIALQGVLVADQRIMVIGPGLSDLQQQMALKEVKTAVLAPLPGDGQVTDFSLKVTSRLNSTLCADYVGDDEGERQRLLQSILAYSQPPRSNEQVVQELA